MSENAAPEKVSPTIEKPAEQKPPEIDKDALLSELTKMGVTKADELIGMKRASSETGKLANMLGEVRNENAELKRMVEQLTKSQNAGYQEQPQPIDLGNALKPTLKSTVKEVIQEMNQQQIDVMNQQWEEMNKIQENRWYPAVKDIWEKYLNHPATQGRLRAGRTNLTEEYRNVVDTYTNRILETQQAALQQARGVKPPHVEQGVTHSPQLPTEPDERQRKLKRINEERSKGQLGSDKALEALVGELFPPEIFGLPKK